MLTVLSYATMPFDDKIAALLTIPIVCLLLMLGRPVCNMVL